MKKNRFTRRRLVVLLAAASATAFSATTFAETAASPSQAMAAASSDQSLASQLDEEAKKLVVAGKFAQALEKMEAAEIMSPDENRARRIERVRSFVEIRKGNTPMPDPAKKAAAVPATPSVAPQPTKPAAVAPTAATPTAPTAAAAPVLPAQIPQNVDQAAQQIQKTAEDLYKQYPPEEQRVRKVLDKFLAQVSMHMQVDQSNDAPRFVVDKNYKMKKDGDKYVAVLNQFDLVDKRNDGLFMAPVTFTLTPKTDALIDISMSFPDLMTIKDSGKIVANISMASQKLEGTWNEQYEMFEQALGKLEDVSIKAVDQPSALNIKRINFFQGMKGKKASAWKQDVKASVSGIDMAIFKDSGEKEGDVHIGSIALNGAVAGKDLDEALRIGKSMQKQAEKAAANNSTLEADAAFMKELMGMFDLFTAYNFDFAIKDVAVNEAGEAPFSIKDFSWGMVLDKQQSGAWSADIKLGFSELNAPAQPGMPPQLVPDAFHFNLRVDNFPPEMMSLAMQAGEDPQKQAQLPGMLLQKMQEYKTGVSLKDTMLNFPDYSLALDANAGIDMQSPFMTAGEANLSVVNLPKLMELAKQMGAPEDVNKMISAVALASVRTETNGQVKDAYHLQWGADGKILLNGKDASALMQPPADDSANQPATGTGSK